MAGFLSPLRLLPQERGRRWQLVTALVYRSDIAGWIIVPKDFVCDLNSLPRFLWWLSPKTDYPEAGAVHDYLYATGDVSRAMADAVYREALLQLGAGRVRSAIRYWALRVFGCWAYRPPMC